MSQKFAAPGRYASGSDAHGSAGHHTGIDFGSLWPTSIDDRIVRSVLDGEVMAADYSPSMGYWVGVYNEAHNLYLSYWHLRVSLVRKGQRLLAYAPVGRVGSTGNSTAPHLHFQVNDGLSFDYGGHVDPSFALGVWRRSDAKRRYLKELLKLAG